MGRALGPFGPLRPRTLTRPRLVLLLVLGLSELSQPQASCPPACECKWKSGKESVVCSERAGFRAVPPGLSPDTQMLDLTRNPIPELPNQVFRSLALLNLQKIILRECGLGSVGPEAFAKLSNLMELDLSGNRLPDVPSSSFSPIPELRELKLSSNELRRIRNGAFLSLPRLIRLELTGCRLQDIETWAFRGLQALQWLRLDNNLLVTVQAESFFPLRSLHGLTVHGNPWNCTCALQPWRDWMAKNNVPYGVPPLCAGPVRLEGKSWAGLSLKDFACRPRQEGGPEGRSVVVLEGQNATLSCKLSATPDTLVRWVSGSRGDLEVSDRAQVTGSALLLTEAFVPGQATGSDGGEGSPEHSLGLKVANLTIIRAALRDSGIFICLGENSAGSISQNFSVNVLGRTQDSRQGRLLLTGALVAGLLILLVCLLLGCIMVGARRARTTRLVLIEEKMELGQFSEQNGESGGQNGGHGVPLLMSNHQALTSTNPVVSLASTVRRPSGFPGTYAPLPTIEPGSGGEREEWKRTEPEVKVLRGQKGAELEAGPFDPRLQNSPFQLRTKGLGLGTRPRPSIGGLNGSGERSRPSGPPRPPQPKSRPDQIPDLIHYKGTNGEGADYCSLPRPKRSRETLPASYFQPKNISESQSPLLPYSYGNSFEAIPEGRAAIPPDSPPPGTRLIWAQQRLSMPASPIHEASSGSSYDCHAAQLAAFLQEYRSLQMELLRMSASLKGDEYSSLRHRAESHIPSNVGSDKVLNLTGTQNFSDHLGLQKKEQEHQQLCLKSILKNPGSALNNTNFNNNYMS